jgi:hypothetical protein
MKSFMMVLQTKHLSGDQIEDEMGGACGTYEGEEKYIKRNGLGQGRTQRGGGCRAADPTNP